jgi:hypothetical protein
LPFGRFILAFTGNPDAEPFKSAFWPQAAGSAGARRREPALNIAAPA